MRFIIENRGEIVFVKCSGRIVAGPELSKLHRAASSQRCRKLVLDLAEVETMDAGGIGVLVRIMNACAQRDVLFKLVNPTQHVREILHLTSLDEVFEISREAEAAESSRTVPSCDYVES